MGNKKKREMKKMKINLENQRLQNNEKLKLNQINNQK